jgi:hypothetical protein
VAILRSTVLGGDDSPLAVTVNLDPTTNVVDAPAGSLIIFGALWYRKKVSGSNTDVVPVAASDLPGWGRENLADSLTADPLDLWGLAAFVGQRWVAKRAGSITGLSARLSTPVTAGSITVEAYKNNVATGFTVVLDTTAGTNQKNFSSQAQEASAASTFVAKDDLDLRVTTTATFTPTGTAELAAFLEIST